MANAFQRCVINDVMYYTLTQRNSYTVCYRHEGVTKFSEIEYFLCLCMWFFASISQLLQKISHFELPHSALGISRIFFACAGPVVLVPVEFLMCKCVSVKLQSGQYLCIPPNSCCWVEHFWR